MQCSGLHDDLFKKGLLDSPECACSTANEDAFHYLCECPRYRLYREKLQTAIIILAPFTIHTLLYGSKNCTVTQNQTIFEAAHEYIRDTGRLGAIT